MTKFNNLYDLYNAMKAGELDNADWTSLPTFSDSDVKDTYEVWSWDDEEMIVGSCKSDLTIVARRCAQ